MALAETGSGGRSGALRAFLWKAAKLTLSVAVTFLGLLIVTFLIGRVVPVDPVLAVVGDRASQSTYDKAFIELGLDKPLTNGFDSSGSGHDVAVRNGNFLAKVFGLLLGST